MTLPVAAIAPEPGVEYFLDLSFRLKQATPWGGKIGDEMAYGKVKKQEVSNLIDNELKEDIPISHIVAEAKKRYNVFFILLSYLLLLFGIAQSRAALLTCSPRGFRRRCP